VPGTNVTLTNQYLLNLGGEQVTALNGTGCPSPKCHPGARGGWFSNSEATVDGIVDFERTVH
jgi:hypothetical protein